MLRPPTLSLKKEQLKLGQKISRDLIKVEYSDKNGIHHGYFKQCSKFYPPLLAKYQTAMSVFMGSSLGDLAPEMQLVYDKDGIVGTVCHVPKTVPLAESSISNYKYQSESKQLNFIDYEKFSPAFTRQPESSISNYKYQSESKQLNLTDYENLSPAFTRKPELSLFPSLYPKISPAPIQSQNTFFKLLHNPEFNRQKNTAILKELLAYNETVLEQRLHLYLENERLDLHTLSPDIRTNLMKATEKDGLFKDLEDKPNAFIKHCMRFYELTHKDFKSIVLSYPDFRDFLKDLDNKPEELVKIKQWFEESNKHTTVPHSIDQLDEQYQSIWNECFNEPSNSPLFDWEVVESSMKPKSP